VLNARDAADRGAVIRTRTQAVTASRDGESWRVTVQDLVSGRRETIAARALVNAAGPWVEQVLRDQLGLGTRGRVRLVGGAHIVVRKLFDHDRAYLLQNPDGRVVFAIPYEHEFTLIGTTDREHDGDPGDTHATPDEIAYLCEAASRAFAKAVRPDDIVWTFSGVRPLVDDDANDARSVSRDYKLELDSREGKAPLLSIIGGKITTYRKLAEAALERLAPHFHQREGLAAGWTGTAALPGGEFETDQVEALATRLGRAFPFLGAPHATRLTRAYGTRAWTILGGAKSMADLGVHFGASLTEAEVRYLVQHEWAQTAEDVAWRRSKLGLHMAPDEIAALDTWMRDTVARAALARTPAPG